MWRFVDCCNCCLLCDTAKSSITLTNRNLNQEVHGYPCERYRRSVMFVFPMHRVLCYDTNSPDEFLPTLPQPLHPLFHVTPFANDSASNSRSACWKYFAVSTPCYKTRQIPSRVLTLCSTYLVVVYKVEHGHNVQKDTSISRVPRSHTLHVVCELGGCLLYTSPSPRD